MHCSSSISSQLCIDLTHSFSAAQVQIIPFDLMNDPEASVMSLWASPVSGILPNKAKYVVISTRQPRSMPTAMWLL